MSTKLPLNAIAFTFLIIIAVFIISFFTLLTKSNSRLEQIYQQTNQYLITHPQTSQIIFSQIFPQAQGCNNSPNCQQDIANLLNQTLQTQGIPYKFYESTYFIKLRDNPARIEKLFLNGQWQIVDLYDSGHKHVYEWLHNRKAPGYLQGIRINEFYSNMIYLKDFYSEAEIIIPIFIDNQMIGAAVIAYGD